MKTQFTILLAIFLLANAGYCQNNCDTISKFPWTESFETNGTNIPLCWVKEPSLFRPWIWNVVDNSTALQLQAHSGNYQAFITCQGDDLAVVYCADLASPVFDFSEVNDPVLTFWRFVSGKASLSVACIDSVAHIWQTLQFFFENNTTGWQKETIHLPNNLNHYQIVFRGQYNDFVGNYGKIHLDDISISDGELSVPSSHTDYYSIAPNPVHDFATISGISPQQLTLYDCQGKVVLTQSNHSNVVDMSQLPQGLYFLHIISDSGKVVVQKVIKQ